MLITGLCKIGVIENVMRALGTNVIEAAGIDDVDVYVHTQPTFDSNLTSGETLQLIRALLPPHVLRGSIVTERAHRMVQKRDGLAGGGWKHEPHDRLQFSGLAELYGLVLARERILKERYGYVARVRSDTLMLSKWPKLAPETPDQHPPPWQQLVPSHSVAGPGWVGNGHRSDKMFIAPRDSSWRVFMEMPHFFDLRLSAAGAQSIIETPLSKIID